MEESWLLNTSRGNHMKRHACINTNNEVINVIVWDGVSPVKFPSNWTVMQFDICDIGDTYDPENNKIIRADRTGTNPEPAQ